jgi:penicillin amidase
VSERALSFALAECYDQDPTFDYTVLLRREGPLWALVSTRPLHLLDPTYATWNDLFVASIDDIIRRLEVEGTQDLRSRVWSQMNVTTYRHPLSGAVPFLSKWLDMPERALAGDLYTPNMHWGAQGPSERMVVSPGRESEGLMQMPTGQSGHPLSPFYANSHEAWVSGRPTPFLPGQTEHTLTLAP